MSRIKLKVEDFGLAPSGSLRLYCSVNLTHAARATLIISVEWEKTLGVVRADPTLSSHRLMHPCDECGYDLFSFVRWELMKAHAHMENEVWSLPS